MTECIPSDAGGNVGLAFGIVTAAGLSTTLGAALAFVMPYSRDAKNLLLAACLSIAAGVMTYVSFVEIFATKAIPEFEKCSDPRFAYLYATLCFFGGILITYIFDKALHFVERYLVKRKAKKMTKSQPDSPESSPATTSDPSPHDSSNAVQNSVDNNPLPMSTDVENQQSRDTPCAPCVDTPCAPCVDTPCAPCVAAPTTPTADEPMDIDHEVGHDGHMVASLYDQPTHDAKALIRMGIFAGIALGFHNFPEGLATFVAVLEDPSVGASVAIAIGIHNIPEGVCVAMPIYYATGSRRKAFIWATLSGLTELIGALLGWVVLRRVITPLVYGVLFGIVAGMMVYISLKELLPTAHRYDPEDKVTTIFLIAGMVVMALSLVLFQF